MIFKNRAKSYKIGWILPCMILYNFALFSTFLKAWYAPSSYDFHVKLWKFIANEFQPTEPNPFGSWHYSMYFKMPHHIEKLSELDKKTAVEQYRIIIYEVFHKIFLKLLLNKCGINARFLSNNVAQLSSFQCYFILHKMRLFLCTFEIFWISTDDDNMLFSNDSINKTFI